MAGKGRPGPDPRPKLRKQHTVRFWNHEVYAAAAAEAGMDFGSYVNAVMAQAHGLPLPGDCAPPGGQLALSDDLGEEAAA